MFAAVLHTQDIQNRMRALTEIIGVTAVGGRSFVAPLVAGVKRTNDLLQYLYFKDSH